MPINKESKHNKVKACLKSGATISQKEAIDYFNAYRLAPIINRLIASGMRIKNIGDPGKFAIYKLQR